MKNINIDFVSAPFACGFTPRTTKALFLFLRKNCEGRLNKETCLKAITAAKNGEMYQGGLIVIKELEAFYKETWG